MKPFVYCTIISLILSILFIHGLNLFYVWNRENAESAAFILTIPAITVVGAVLGFWCQINKKMPDIRPIAYWPLIGVLLGLIIKGGGIVGFFIFVSISFVIGIIFECRRGKY